MRRSAGAAAIPVPTARSLANAARRVYWLDQPDAPEPLATLAGNITADLAIVGGGFTGLWTALLATERDPSLDVVMVEARTAAQSRSLSRRDRCVRRSSS